MSTVSLKDTKYFVVFTIPVLFFALQMDWSSSDGISDLFFGLSLFLVFPLFLFIMQMYYFLEFDRKMRHAGRVKSKVPFVLSYCTIAMFDLIMSGHGALDIYKGVSGSALNVIMLFFLPIINVVLIALIYAIPLCCSAFPRKSPPAV